MRTASAQDPARTLHGERCSFTLNRAGASLAPVVFRGDGRQDFSPLFVAPWAHEPWTGPSHPLLQHLRGDWPCVPFGRTQRPEGLSAAWGRLQVEDAWDHGYPANHDWHWMDSPAGSLKLGLDGPQGSALKRIERIVRFDDLQPWCVVTDLRIEVHQDVCWPLALHPTMALDQGRTRLILDAAGGVVNFPVAVEPGSSVVLPGQHHPDLRGWRSTSGDLDLDHFPLKHPTEELLQAIDVHGRCQLDYLDLGWSIELTWPQDLLPDLMIWVSHGGRLQAPWLGRTRALGLEPCHACFDLGRVAQAPIEHPLHHRKGVTLRRNEALNLTYRMQARPHRGLS